MVSRTNQSRRRFLGLGAMTGASAILTDQVGAQQDSSNELSAFAAELQSIEGQRDGLVELISLLEPPLIEESVTCEFRDDLPAKAYAYPPSRQLQLSALTGCWGLRNPTDKHMNHNIGAHKNDCVVTVQSAFVISDGGKSVHLKVCFYCAEQGDDNTSFQGEKYVQVYTAPQGEVVVAVPEQDAFGNFSTPHSIPLTNRQRRNHRGERVREGLYGWRPIDIPSSYWKSMQVRVDELEPNKKSSSEYAGVKGNLKFTVRRTNKTAAARPDSLTGWRSVDDPGNGKFKYIGRGLWQQSDHGGEAEWQEICRSGSAVLLKCVTYQGWLGIVTSSGYYFRVNDGPWKRYCRGVWV